MSGEDHIRQQDEILQMMYWMKGEGLGSELTRDELNRLLNFDPERLEDALARLQAASLIARNPNDRYRLTERGLAEAGRRFTDEFSSFLGKESHVQCDDPECDCHSPDLSGVCRSLAESG